jgi:lipoprotein-anchoring transpeptidase ErfK/SrfK
VIGTAAFDAGAAQRAAPRKLDVTVDLSRRQLEVRVGGKLTGRYSVAVGKADSRTPVGTYRLSRVIWNPSWVPPDDKWAQNAEPKGPREPGNPMGRVKILFGPELYVHGTAATGTLGEPASHGCIRMSNRDASRLARLVMESGGAHRAPAWYSKVQADGKRSVEVEIPNPPSLRIAE